MDQPLAGVRIIECSMLGPGAITTSLADLGADVIKVEPPAGDYIRQMTWPIVEGVSLMHLHINRGKQSDHARPAHRGGRAIFHELVAAADAVIEAMRPGGLARRGLGYEDLKAVNPTIVFCTISGYGMTGPYKDMPSHGIAYDTWAGLVNARDRRGGLLRTSPSTRRSASTPARCSARSACSPASSGPARPARARCSRSRSPTPRPRWTGSAPRRGRRTSGPRTRSPATRPTTSSAAPRAPPACATASATRSTRPPTTPRAVHGVRAGVLEELLRGRRPAWTCSRSGPAAKYADHAKGNRELQAILREIFLTKTAAEWLEFGDEVNTPIAPVNTPKTIAEDPQFQDRLGLPAGGGARRRAAAVARQVRRRGEPGPDARRRRSASTTTRSSPTCSATTTRRSRAAAASAGALG